MALPAPGDLAGVPGAPAEAQGAAAEAGECVFVPGVGGMLVPTVAVFGPSSGSRLDTGTRVDWRAFDADPVPRHRVEALEPSQLERHLRQELLDATEALERSVASRSQDKPRGVRRCRSGGRGGCRPGCRPGRTR